METTTLTLCLDHLYYLTADSNNNTGYTLEEVQALIDEKGGSFEIEATITHPTPPPYSVEWDIQQHEERIANNQQYLITLREQLSQLEEDTQEYTSIQEQITAVEEDIVACENYIASIS
jgi:DNA-binding transcriptional MerR regulator